MDGSSARPEAYVLDPVRQQWTEIAGLFPLGRAESIDVRGRYNPGGRWGHMAVASPDGRVFVFGGFAAVAWGAGYDSLWTRVIQYDPATRTWTYAGDLGSGRIEHSATLLPDGTILIIGGLANPDVTLTDKTRIDGAVFRYIPAPRQHAASSPVR
ncbi:MAG TPA: kelch repeat-containing protein [Polyangia bacterium]|jgi:N-acetylneuraminic acid mutarotase|nr:kelch repeat-containing protein [Polyangia bacterium]